MTRGEENSLTDVRERLVRIETHFQNIEKTMTSMKGQVGELHDVHMKAKGARWAFYTSIPVISGVISYFVSHYQNNPPQ